MKVMVLSGIMLAVAGCQSKSNSEQPKPSVCNKEVNATYIESTDAIQNQAIIDSLSSHMVEITANYQQSLPSELSWSIQDEKLRFDSNDYALQYSADNALWNVINERGAMVGILAPYKTSSCELIAQLKLSMFIPSEEEALADIAYATL